MPAKRRDKPRMSGFFLAEDVRLLLGSIADKWSKEQDDRMVTKTEVVEKAVRALAKRENVSAKGVLP